MKAPKKDLKRDFAWLDNREVLLGLQSSLQSDGRIADAAGCSVSQVQHLRARYGIPSRGESGRPPTYDMIWNPATLAALVKICGNPHLVAKTLGIRYETVKNAMTHANSGVAPNPRRHR